MPITEKPSVTDSAVAHQLAELKRGTEELLLESGIAQLERFAESSFDGAQGQPVIGARARTLGCLLMRGLEVTQRLLVLACLVEADAFCEQLRRLFRYFHSLIL